MKQSYDLLMTDHVNFVQIIKYILLIVSQISLMLSSVFMDANFNDVNKNFVKLP